MRTLHLLVTMAAAALAACNGGGGDDPPPGGGGSETTVTLSGTAAKGLLASADVAVLPVGADGSVGSTALATGVTRSDGSYSLVFTATSGQPYVVRVVANAATTHLDEVTGAAQALPAGFTMRSLLTPAGSGAVTATTQVTPFTELAVAAAARAAGGLTAANATQALSTVKQLVGFDPTTVAVKSTTGAGSADEQKQAVLLTAVAKMAADGSLGCAAGSAGDKVKCVVDALGAASRIDSLKLATGSGAGAQDVSAALGGAIGQVLANPGLSGSVSSTLLANVVANLGCTSDCAAGSTGGAGTVATAIAGARLMFNEIRTDWSAMFSRGGSAPAATGAFNKEAAAFESAMNGAQLPVEMLAKDLGAMLLGVDLYNDYQAGRTNTPTRSKLLGDGFSDDGSGNFSASGATACSLYKDSTNVDLATNPAEAKSIGCRALYFISRKYTPAENTTLEWRHGFTILPQADGSFDYTTRARRRDTSCSATACPVVTANVNLQIDASGAAVPAFAGKLTPTLSGAYGEIRSFRVVGELPAAFKDGGRTLVNFKHTVDVSGTETVTADGMGKSEMVTGTLVAYRDATTFEGTLTLKTGTLKLSAASGVYEPDGVDLDIVWATGGSEFEGRIALTDSVFDKDMAMRVPTKALLSGELRNTAGGVTTEFARGSFSAEVTGYPAFESSKPLSPSNSFKLKLTLLAAVSASSRPTLEVSLGTESDAYAAENGGTLQATLQYRTLVAGKPRQVVKLEVQGSATGAATYKLSEDTANISLAWTGDHPAGVDLMYAGSTKIGRLDTATGLLTFSDGSFVSVDSGL